ncbi:Uncharacterised protein [Fusobacterium polymorphum]|uniref:HK97 gp10 family phage protein n=1 Tax=Fusobacterium polymorphum ATCC 10953 TaxID=393480 RepID=A5TX39_FUSNP|nr:HK97 gp10 family phage protein [Fusobacterium polymorphum]EDK89464.1 hypothetical protein FNP_1691 [Fusobacterium polymorphum ATCC 10953]UTI52606.1 HK97 gp10 family phage protein [Fusobacterium polymorphum]WRL69347.1 HK97 gp10 family phage protein [Fusobacterium polymorphum]CKH08696.1 Uncharacterised protein [Fusobacterium polymorphum]
MDGFTTDELDELEKEVLRLAKKYPNETKKFLQKQGNKLKGVAKKIAKSKVKIKTGNYMKGFKRGKYYKWNGEDDCIRVYNYMPHAHLIENGHIIKDRTGKEHGFKKGYFILAQAHNDFYDEFVKSTDDFVGEVIKNGGF